MSQVNPRHVTWPVVDRQWKTSTVYDIFQYPWRERQRANSIQSWPWVDRPTDSRYFVGKGSTTEISLTVAQNNTWLDVGFPPATKIIREFYFPIPCDYVAAFIQTGNELIPQEGLEDDDEWLEYRMEVGVGSGDFSNTVHIERQSFGALWLTRFEGTLHRDISADGTNGTDVQVKMQRRHNVNSTRKVWLEQDGFVMMHREDD